METEKLILQEKERKKKTKKKNKKKKKKKKKKTKKQNTNNNKNTQVLSHPRFVYHDLVTEKGGKREDRNRQK
jgi:hypothetical protein